ncbi:MAG: hypothetical protein ABI285_03015 [Ginsengibacter sp.]
MAKSKFPKFFKALSQASLKGLVIILCLSAFPGKVMAQAEVEPWGNITGIRHGGQLIGFESSLRVVEDGWSKIKSTARERQRPNYKRIGNMQIIETKIDSINFTETVGEEKDGSANVDVKVSSKRLLKRDEIFFVVAFPLVDYKIAIIDQKSGIGALRKNLVELDSGTRFIANGVRFKSKTNELQFIFDSATEIIFRKDAHDKNIAEIYIPLIKKHQQSDTVSEKKILIVASGLVDKRAISFKLDPSKAGRPFDGFGGNFRLQNPKADPQVINYCLQNLRVAWGRVEFPWRFWQPDENVDPVIAEKNGSLNAHVQQSMEMAARLGKMGIPVILSGWFPPQWAVSGPLNMRPVNGVWGNPLDSTKMEAIYKSITDYIIYLKENYGVEIRLFSFNESDLGINVRQTPAQHDALIKGLGAYFKSHGLHTKMLLGDNSDATSYQFIYPALNDPGAKPFIGAISFHSWRGWDFPTLEKWKAAADQLNVPLIVGEGSIDAAAWNYPAIFEEQTYIMQEIKLYIRLLSICQPLTILQWQLTSDYSPLAGGGIFGNDEPLRPTQRFWNFKQLASTPKGLFVMPVTCDRPDITVAALGDNKKKRYTIHMVNDGAGREANLTGLPSFIKAITKYSTNKNNDLKEGPVIKVLNGKAKFFLESETFVTLITE